MASQWQFDLQHSGVSFTIRHLMVSKVRGRFNRWSGSMRFDENNLDDSSVEVQIDAASVDTSEPQRDAHLRSADFFDVERFPTLTFESTRIYGTPDDFVVDGKLTIHGVARDVSLRGNFEGRANDPWGGVRVGYSAHTTINRKDFGLTWNAALETGGVVVGEEVRIELNVEAILKQ